MFSLPNALQQLFQAPHNQRRRRRAPAVAAEACEVRLMLSAVQAIPAAAPSTADQITTAVLASTGQSLLSLAVLKASPGTYDINFTSSSGGSVTGSISVSSETISETLNYTSANGQKWTEQGTATVNGSTVKETLKITPPSGQPIVETGTFTLAKTSSGKTLVGSLSITEANGKTIAANVAAGVYGNSYQETVDVTGPNGGKFEETATITDAHGKANVSLTIVGPQGKSLHTSFTLTIKS